METSGSHECCFVSTKLYSVKSQKTVFHIHLCGNLKSLMNYKLAEWEILMNYILVEMEIFAALWKRVLLCDTCACHSGVAAFWTLLEYYAAWRDKYIESCLKWKLDLMETCF